MKQPYLAAIALAVLTIVPTASASACSVGPEYRVPTNLELAADAQLIILARVVGETEHADFWKSMLLVEPVEAIKGTFPTSLVSIAAARLDPRLEAGGSGMLSNPYELTEAHPESYSGACVRRVFPRGTTALFFLKRNEDGEGWRSSGDAFSRWAEDVLSEDAPWLQLTRFYANIAHLPDGERAAMLEVERDRFADLVDDPVAQLMAADIARQLNGPNRTFFEVMEAEPEAFDPLDEVEEAEEVDEFVLPARAEQSGELGLAESMEDDGE